MSGFFINSHLTEDETGYVLDDHDAVDNVPIRLVTEIDAGNASLENSTIENADGAEPVITIKARASAISGATSTGWRHCHFAVDDAIEKRPIFVLDRSEMTNPTVAPTANWLPLWTQDFETWVQAPSRTLSGGANGTIAFQFADELPEGMVYVATQPLGRQIDAVNFANALLSLDVAEPAESANASGVIGVTPAETADGVAVGENPIYGFKLAWPGPTTDGGPKRKLVQLAGTHAAGENTSWLSFQAAVEWMLFSGAAEAEAFRANWDVYLYFNVTPNGIRGGQRRNNFRVATDPNRDFLAKSLFEIATITAAAEADTGGLADAMFSWHGFSIATEAFIPGTLEPFSAVTDRFIEIGTELVGTYRPYPLSNNTTDYAWGANVLNAKLSFAAEVPQRGVTLPQFFRDIGTNWMRTLQQVDAEGFFYTPQFDVTPQGVAQTQTLGEPTLSTTASLTPASMVQTQSVEAGVLQQAHVIVPLDLVQLQGLGIATIVQAHQLSVASVVQAQGIGDAVLAVAGQLAVDALSQSQGIGLAELTQQYQLAIDSLIQSSGLGEPIVDASRLTIVPSAVSQQQAASQPGLVTITVLQVQSLTQAQALAISNSGGLVIGTLDGQLVIYPALDGSLHTIH